MQAYINYLKNVLGVQQILKSTENSTESVQQAKVLVWVENLSTFSEDEQILLNNMLAAMKIPSADLAVYDLKDKSEALIAPIQFDLVINPDQSGLQTYSPQALQTNKSLKTAAWAFLQTIIARYKALS